jgi:hypothetical protein
MCQRVDCPTCGKPTFVGCGMHVEQVLGDVPRDRRCQGHAAADQKPKPAEAPRGRPDGDKRS